MRSLGLKVDIMKKSKHIWNSFNEAQIFFRKKQNVNIKRTSNFLQIVIVLNSNATSFTLATLDLDIYSDMFEFKLLKGR